MTNALAYYTFYVGDKERKCYNIDLRSTTTHFHMKYLTKSWNYSRNWKNRTGQILKDTLLYLYSYMHV